VDEVAADIFMGEFSEKFLRAAHTAAEMLEGTLYDRYYGVPFARVRAIDDMKRSRYGTPTSPAFAALCAELAGANGGSRGSVAHNGTIIEQEQILTTHNLAVLFDVLGLTESLRLHLEPLAARCFEWVCRRLRQTRGPWKTRLRAVKNAAYAWRQMVFFATVAPAGSVDSFLAAARERLRGEPTAIQERIGAALAGVARAAQGLPVEAGPSPEEPHGSRRFLGWSTGKHWLLSE